MLIHTRVLCLCVIHVLGGRRSSGGHGRRYHEDPRDSRRRNLKQILAEVSVSECHTTFWTYAHITKGKHGNNVFSIYEPCVTHQVLVLVHNVDVPPMLPRILRSCTQCHGIETQQSRALRGCFVLKPYVCAFVYNRQLSAHSLFYVFVPPSLQTLGIGAIGKCLSRVQWNCAVPFPLVGFWMVGWIRKSWQRL